MSIDTLSYEQLLELKEVVECLIDFSNANIIKTNFIKNFYDKTIDGRLYGSFKLFGAKSFRPTSSSPSLLNMPSTGSIYSKPVKKAFVAEKGWIYYIVDLNALEDRVVANLSGERNKIAIFQENIDGHCLNSHYYFEGDLQKVLPRDEDESLYDYVRRYHKEVKSGNKALEQIRQDSKPCTFALAYGCYPPKLSQAARMPIERAEHIWTIYRTELYPGIQQMTDKVERVAIRDGRIHLGLGCYLYSSNPRKEIRTLFNACSQFWSILTLLTVNKMNHLIREHGYEDRIEVCCTIYDSIYFHLEEDPELIKWLNDNVIPILTTNFLEDQVVPNSAIAEIGYNWYDIIQLENNAPLEEVQNIIEKAKSIVWK